MVAPPSGAQELFGAPHQIRSIVAAGYFHVAYVHTPVAGFVVRYALRRMQKASRPAAELGGNKRQGNVLRAVATLHDKYVHVAFAGEGPFEGRLAELTRELAISSQVHFLGHRTDIPALISASTATLIVFRARGSTALESLSLRVPVMASDNRGNGELLENGSGRFIALRDCGALAHAMKQLASSPELLSSPGRQSRREIHGYELRTIMELHSALYQRAISSES